MGLLPTSKDWTDLRASFKSLVNPAPRKAITNSETRPTEPFLREWDKGVFVSELIKKSIFPRSLESENDEFIIPSNRLDPLTEGTLQGSKKASTEMYLRIQQRFASYFDIANFESTIPQQPLSPELKRTMYTFQKPGSDNYPPHLNLVPGQVANGINLLEIFNFMRLLDTGLLLPRIIPEKILDFVSGDPLSDTMAGLEKRNSEIRTAHKNVGEEPNIGDRSDWYTDAVFAQQQFTGPNPIMITRASSDWIEKFTGEAKAQKNQKVIELLASSATDSLYVQDYSYFRDALKAPQDAAFTSDDGKRFACASVCLYQLEPDGKLHPLIIILDYKGSIVNSVVIFNKRLTSSDSSASEITDWPWRYAKLCVQVSDWTCHELTVHLTNTHFVEEVVIVAAHRTLPTDHIIYRLMEPHWLKTLPLNAAARSSLVPGFIVDINGMTSAQTYAFISNAYREFDWKAKYIPNDLPSRGFPLSDLQSNTKFHNYVYGKNMLLLWNILRDFASTAIRSVYKSDTDVQFDDSIQAFSAEMRNQHGGAMPKFPVIKTVDDLIDMVVMAIHIASPQHTAVNYLQDYYMAFVPNKPGCLCSPLPTTLDQLNDYKEADMMRALPINSPRVWLMSSHLPYLLSYQVSQKQTLLNYALSLQKLAKNDPGDPIGDAGEQLLKNLTDLKEAFLANSNQMDDQTLPYRVMDPDITAVSILL